MLNYPIYCQVDECGVPRKSNREKCISCGVEYTYQFNYTQLFCPDCKSINPVDSKSCISCNNNFDMLILDDEEFELLYRSIKNGIENNRNKFLSSYMTLRGKQLTQKQILILVDELRNQNKPELLSFLEARYLVFNKNSESYSHLLHDLIINLFFSDHLELLYHVICDEKTHLTLDNTLKFAMLLEKLIERLDSEFQIKGILLIQSIIIDKALSNRLNSNVDISSLNQQFIHERCIPAIWMFTNKFVSVPMQEIVPNLSGSPNYSLEWIEPIKHLQITDEQLTRSFKFAKLKLGRKIAVFDGLTILERIEILEILYDAEDHPGLGLSLAILYWDIERYENASEKLDAIFPYFRHLCLAKMEKPELVQELEDQYSGELLDEYLTEFGTMYLMDLHRRYEDKRVYNIASHLIDKPELEEVAARYLIYIYARATMFEEVVKIFTIYFHPDTGKYTSTKTVELLNLMAMAIIDDPYKANERLEKMSDVLSGQKETAQSIIRDFLNSDNQKSCENCEQNMQYSTSSCSFCGWSQLPLFEF